jgi:hemerythrin-like domain-containing protein
MTIAFPGHRPPAAGFDLPLEMLEACHRRVERQCATLRRVVPHLSANGADAQARDAAQAVMRYFDTAAPRHHADEEEDLFPALLESMAGSDAVCLREIIQGLCDQHRELERRWAGLRRDLVRVASGQGSTLSLDDVEAFVALYEGHIAREENELLPMARRLLADAEIDRIGRAMLDRRGLSDKNSAP